MSFIFLCPLKSVTKGLKEEEQDEVEIL